MRKLLLLGIVYLVAGPAAGEIRRTVEMRDASGNVTRTEKSLDTTDDTDDQREDDDRHDHRESRHHDRHRGGSAGAIDLSDSTDSSPGFIGGGLLPVSRSLSLGYSATNVFNKMTTGFSSASFPSLAWKSNPDLDGQGVEGAFHFVDGAVLSLGVRGGYFKGSNTANAQQSGSFYVQERVKTEGGWADLEAQTASFYGVSFLVGLGGLSYSVKTQVDTNAPVYRYEGLSGSRTEMIFGIGGQFEVPWHFPVKPYVQGRYWWTAGAGDPQENGIGQFSAGINWHFSTP